MNLVFIPAALAMGGVLATTVGNWLALRLARLTRGLIGTPDEWTLVSGRGVFATDEWLDELCRSSFCEWNQKARMACRFRRLGRYAFIAGWLGVILCIISGRA